MATTDDASDSDPVKVSGLTTVKVEVNGTSSSKSAADDGIIT